MRNRAFTLIELLMVMLIIGIVIAIVVPALGGARQAARRATTQQVQTEIVNAASAFQNTNDRLPGFYSVQEMGLASNEDYGLTAMENAMLELIGGIVDDPYGGIGGGGGAGAEDILEIEIPGTNRTVYVDPQRATGDYYVPDAAFYRPMLEGQQEGSDEHVGEGDFDPQLKDVVDSWGNPMLWWGDDRYGPSKIDEVEDFARLNSGTGGPDDRSHFYWASNAGFLNSTNLGKGARSQLDSYRGSLIADIAGNDVAESLTGILGHPSFPNDRSLNAQQILPTTGRGAFVIHSAGVDGVYFSRRDRGSKAIGSTDGSPILYGLNFKTSSGPGGADLVNEDGQVETRDIIMDFDDMVQSGGN